MKKLYCILVLFMMVMFVALSASGQVGQVSKPTRSTKQTTSTTKASKPAGKTNKTTTRSTSSKHSSSGKNTSTARSYSNSNANNTSSSVVEVTINSNAEAADVYVDNSYCGVAGSTFNIKTGSHVVQLVADGYEDYVDNFTVTGSNRSFRFTMTKKSMQSLTDLMDDMVFIHGGVFTMGSKGLDAEFDEKPAHEVILPSFYMCRYEVTQQLWMDVMGGNPSRHTGEMRPVESVSWEDCQLFISRLNAMTGIVFRLPSEAEWEYAARGGNESQGFMYAGSDSIDDVAWYNTYDSEPHDIGGKQPNELGLYDMSGNVMEWCADWHGPYTAGRQKSPTGAPGGEYRVARGGYWESEAKYCTVTYRHPITPDEVSEYIGLRLVAKNIKPKNSKK